MANQEQLIVLKKGVTAWNEWRERNSRTQVDLSDANLSMLDLVGANFSLADLMGAKLIGTNLTGAKLMGADLSRADLREAFLGRADLCGADLQEADLRSTTLIGANLSRTNLGGTHLREADLRGSNLREADLRGANLSDVKLMGADLRDTKLRRANLSRSDLKEAKLTGADLRGTDFTEAKLMGADLTSTQALATNFTAAKLTRACLENWNINSATQLDDVVCDYVYLRSNDQGRCPRTGSFAPGEFTQLFQQSISTIEIALIAPVNWVALSIALIEIETEQAEAQLVIQRLEYAKDDRVVLVLGVAAKTDVSHIRDQFLQRYEAASPYTAKLSNLALGGPETEKQRADQEQLALNHLFRLLHWSLKHSRRSQLLFRQMHHRRFTRPKVRSQKTTKTNRPNQAET
ncbi:MAG: pentapeptide repeat-containing protein [Leptolyngbyaceae cyanobacterium bins.59]|nr:pentapeptide repeat-containing protein [Leptolyngbyaceae cyanobacterium bins.59]